ncbi:MAG: hypothetical protein GY803_16310, partial [Chloroflexi bacterium]|nr:hypothetical protein [Chloroflexota bacterium]
SLRYWHFTSSYLLYYLFSFFIFSESSANFAHRESIGFFWEHSQIKLANEISATVSGLMILVSQISELKGLPEEINDEAVELLKSHSTERSEMISELLQKFIDHRGTIQNQLDALSEDERARRSYLVDAVSLFQQLAEYVIPSDSDTGEHRLDLDGIHEYAERLSEVFLHAEHLRLLLISDVLGMQSTS